MDVAIKNIQQHLRIVTLSVSMLTISGCAYDVASRYYLNEKLPPRPVAEVEVLTAVPTRPYEVIADFQARRESVEGMRERGAEVGADAVFVSKLGGYYSHSEEWAGEDRHSLSGSRITATAIRYKQSNK